MILAPAEPSGIRSAPISAASPRTNTGGLVRLTTSRTFASPSASSERRWATDGPIATPVGHRCSAEAGAEPVGSSEAAAEPLRSAELGTEPLRSAEAGTEPLRSAKAPAEPDRSAKAEPDRSAKAPAEPVRSVLTAPARGHRLAGRVAWPGRKVDALPERHMHGPVGPPRLTELSCSVERIHNPDPARGKPGRVVLALLGEH